MSDFKGINKVVFKDLGLIDYKLAWDYQQKLNQKLIARKRAFQSTNKPIESFDPLHYLLICEHPPVYTLGKSGTVENLLLDSDSLQKAGIDYYKINRGGDITYHGPGQIVVYPIFDLEFFFTDVHKYVRYLEEVIIRVLSEYGLRGIRNDGYTGVWLEGGTLGIKRKVCAIGVHLSRWVSLHGLAFNINPNLKHFENIIPCGINEVGRMVSSLEKELGEKQDLELAKMKIKAHFSTLFEFEYVS